MHKGFLFSFENGREGRTQPTFKEEANQATTCSPFSLGSETRNAQKEWKLGVSSVSPIVTSPPIKLIASVPIDWDEMPGKPFPCFSQPEVLPSQPEKLLCLPPPPMFSQGCGGVDYHNDEYSSDDGHDECKGLFELDLEAFDFDTDDSFSSVPSVLANCLVPSEVIFSAVPVEKSFSNDNASDKLKIPSSPASDIDSSTSSYATGASSLVGPSFLECLFPLLPPKSSFLEKTRYSGSGSLTPPEMKPQNFYHESNSSIITRRPTTLGELIMMSRRRSYQKKAVQMRKQYLSMEFEKRASRCSIFGTSIKIAERLQRKKHQLIMKLLY